MCLEMWPVRDKTHQRLVKNNSHYLCCDELFICELNVKYTVSIICCCTKVAFWTRQKLRVFEIQKYLQHFKPSTFQTIHISHTKFIKREHSKIYSAMSWLMKSVSGTSVENNYSINNK